MKTFLVSAVLAPAAYGAIAEHYIAAGAPPTCEVDGTGMTHVYYIAAQHPSFKCTHAGAVCSCTLKHPTHDKGGCKQLESKLAGKYLDAGGDCADSGKTPSVWASATPTSVTVDTLATFSSSSSPNGVAFTGNTALVADVNGHSIYKVDISTGVKTTLAGSFSNKGFANGVGTAARFQHPCGVTIADADTALVADLINHAIRKIVISTGATTTLAGSGSAGFANGVGTAATFNRPTSVAVDGNSGIALVSDCDNHAIRKIVIATGETSTLAGTGTAGNTDGPGTVAQFAFPYGVAALGGIAVATDHNNHAIRKIVISTGATSTLSGGTGSGHVDGPGVVAQFYRPWGIAMDGDVALVTQNPNSQTVGNFIRRVLVSNGETTTLTGHDKTGFANGLGSDATFSAMHHIAMSPGTNIALVADASNRAIRRITV